MSNKKQFLILVLSVALIAIIIGWVSIGTSGSVDNVQNFTIKNGEVTSYNANDRVVELPYLYKVVNGKAVFGYGLYVTSLGANAFSKDNKIERLAISNNITVIKDDAFNNLDKLTTLVMRCPQPPTIKVQELEKLTNLETIYIYNGNLQNYQNSAVWNTFASKFSVL